VDGELNAADRLEVAIGLSQPANLDRWIAHVTDDASVATTDTYRR
jgi:hypothetical protein